ncbi:MFS transporter [Beutenbergia cavernae]|nr:MFS transporter [Beutenbergia cavernae]
MGVSFRWLLASSWTSNVGDGIALAAGPLLVASQTDSAFLIAMAALLQRLPWLLFGLWAGAIADRLDRRRLVMVANALRAVVVSVLVVSIASGAVSIGVVLAVMFAYGVAEVFADSASQTLLPTLVRPADLGIGNARLQAGYLVANQLVGPPVGAFLFAAGMAWPFAAQVVAVALAVVLVGRIVLPPPPDVNPADDTAERTHVWHDIRDGVRWILAHPPVRTLALVILVFNVTWAAPWGILVKYALDHLHLGEVGFGLLTTATAVGGLVGIASFGWLERHARLATLMRVCLTLEVLMHAALALTTSGPVAIGIMVVFGAYAFVWGTVSATVRQRAVPLAFQGRVGSVYMVAVFGGLAIGQAIGGLLAERWGVLAPFWFAFAGSAITLALVWRQLAQIAYAGAPPEGLDREADPDPPTVG